MYNNPFMNNYAGFNNFGIPMQQEQKQPINNIFTNQLPTQINGEYFMAKMLKKGEKPEEIFVNQKTVFISLADKKISIKETDGSISSYELILPLDEKDLKIQELENEIKELKKVFKDGQHTINIADNEIAEPNGNIKKLGRK